MIKSAKKKNFLERGSLAQSFRRGPSGAYGGWGYAQAGGIYFFPGRIPGRRFYLFIYLFARLRSIYIINLNFFVSFVYMLYLWLLRGCWLGGSSLAPETHHQIWWQHSSQRQNLPESIFFIFFPNNFGLDLVRSFGVKWLNHPTLTLWHLRW